MTRSEKIAKARELREQGLTYREISEELGEKHPTTVHRWLHPEAMRESNRRRHSAKRAWEDAHRANCRDCGRALRAGSSQPSRTHTGQCRSCWEIAEARRVGARAREIEAWWAEGLTLKEIATRLGWSVSRLSVEFHRLREKGYSLPYRRRPRKNAPRFPEQVPE